MYVTNRLEEKKKKTLIKQIGEKNINFRVEKKCIKAERDRSAITSVLQFAKAKGFKE